MTELHTPRVGGCNALLKSIGGSSTHSLTACSHNLHTVLLRRYNIRLDLEHWRVLPLELFWKSMQRLGIDVGELKLAEVIGRLKMMSVTAEECTSVAEWYFSADDMGSRYIRTTTQDLLTSDEFYNFNNACVELYMNRTTKRQRKQSTDGDAFAHDGFVKHVKSLLKKNVGPAPSSADARNLRTTRACLEGAREMGRFLARKEVANVVTAISEFGGDSAFKVGFVSERAIYVERSNHNGRAIQELCTHVNKTCRLRVDHSVIYDEEYDFAREFLLREARALAAAKAAAEAAAAAAAAAAEQQAPDAEVSSSEAGPSAPPDAEAADSAEGVGTGAMDTDEMPSLDRETLIDLYGDEDDAV